MAHVTDEVMKVVAHAYMLTVSSMAANSAPEDVQAIAFNFFHALQIVFAESNAVPARKQNAH